MKKLLLSIFLIGIMSSSSLMAFEPFVVKDIQVVGIQRMSKDAVLQDLPINIGEQITSVQSAAAIHALFDTGFYKDVTLERDGNTLIVKVVERPSIGKFELTGLKSKDEIDKILKDNNIAEGRIYDPAVISKVEKEIIYQYLTKQRYGVKVETTVTPEDRNRVKVEMRVYEGDIATIREIRFVGNEAFTSKQLKAQMFHKTKNLLSWLDKSDHYSKEKLAADLEMLRSFYMDRGYLNFKIESTQVSLSVDKRYVYLTIGISEGPQYFFKNIALSGDMVVDREQMQMIIDQKIKPGTVFSRKSIWEVKDALEERLGVDGYSKATIRIIDEVDPEKRLISLKFYVDANKRITVRRITFTGNTLTEDRVLRRELEQFEGSWISTKKIKDGKESILRNAFASQIDIETVPVPGQDDQVDLLYKIEEQRTAQLSAGISYSGAEKLSFNLAADLKNFVGTGKDINFLFNHSKAIQTYSLGYSNPYFTDSGIGMAYNIYNQKTNLSRTSNIFDYALDATGINLGWQFRLSQYSDFKLGGGYDFTVIKMNYATAPTEAQDFLKAYDYDTGFKEAFVNIGWLHNSLDSFLFPTKGIVNSISFKASIPVAKLRLYKVDYDVNWFKSLHPKGYILNLRLDLGYQATYNNMPFPFYKNYYLGGGDSVRGFEERSLGPKSSQGQPFGGNASAQGRAQIIFPPPFLKENKAIRTALFLDAGQVYDTLSKDVNGVSTNPTGIRYAAGAALTWNTPMNIPIAFSVAWPLNKKPGDATKVFAFSLGTQF